MKAIILAGGSGDRLWPLSRKNYPKQFIQFNNDRSLFQDAITRNMPFCDEFIVVAPEEYREIIEGQLQQFQSLQYKLILEEEPRGTVAAVYQSLQIIDEEELVFVSPSDLMISGRSYSKHIYDAKDYASQGRMALFGITPTDDNNSYGYIRHKNNSVTRFIASPSKDLAHELFCQDDVLWNSGMIITERRVLKGEIERLCSDDISGPIDAKVLEKCDLLSVVKFDCKWQDIFDFETFSKEIGTSQDNVIKSSCDNVNVLNTTSNQLVVANGLENLVVVNTPDAIYISDSQKAHNIKEILSRHNTKAEKYEYSYIDNRPWGIREILKKEPGFRVRKITIFAGLKLSNHMHQNRNENYVVVSGVLTVELDSETIELVAGQSINIEPNTMHRLRNNSDQDVVVIEIDTGAEIDDWDMVHADELIPSLYKMRPAFKDYIWGGSNLKGKYGKATPYDVTAESWELSAHPDGPSLIDGGQFDGMAFDDFLEENGQSLCGWKSQVFDRFPILIKFIDAKNALSVQIHPQDDYAFVNENEFGKNEVWYVLDCQPDAYLYLGLNRDSSVEEIRRKVADESITDILNKVDVKPGDVLFVPAGTIHAIGAGILIAEIQQNSNSTYRMYDYGRLGNDGKPRPLHMDKAMDVVDTHKFDVSKSGVGKVENFDRSTQRLLCTCKYFQVKYYDIPEHEIIMVDDSSFKSILVVEGSAKISCGEEAIMAKAGDSIFVTAGRKRVHVNGSCQLLITNI